jgi:hypothetical protein
MTNFIDNILFDQEYNPILVYKTPGITAYVIRIGPTAKELCFSYEFSSFFLVSAWLLVINN